MAGISHAATSLNSSTPVLLTSISTAVHPVTKATVPNWSTMDLVIQNVDASATVYIGGPAVTSSAYGYKLVAGASLQLPNLPTGTQLYAISSASSNLAVLQILKS